MPDLDMIGGAMPQKPDNHEAAMARADLYKAANYSFKLFKMIQDGQELEGWVQAKITKAADYIASVYHYMEYEMKFNDYGKKLEDSDIYTESVKQQFVQKLTEARVKLEKLKTKNIKDLEEGFEDKLAAAREKAAEKGKTKEKAPEKKSAVRKVAGKAYGGSKQKDDDQVDENLDNVKLGKVDRKKEPNPKSERYYKNKSAVSKAAGSKQKDDKKVDEASKPDFLDVDQDGNKKEPMKKAIADKKKTPFAKKV